MAGTPEGVRKAAATRLGLSLAEYEEHLDAGLLWCWRCREWHPAAEFATDRNRGRGRAAACRRTQNAAARHTYTPRARARGRRYVDARDDDRHQARRRVNHLVDVGLLPPPDSVACTDCGHLGNGPRHEYDHHLGYAPEHHEHVEVVCSACHHRREGARRG